MWEQNQNKTTTNRNISLPEEQTTQDTTINSFNDDNNKLNKLNLDNNFKLTCSLNELDSGFMSGPQEQLTSEQLSEISTTTTTIPSTSSTNEKYNYKNYQLNDNIDSGLIEDHIEDEEEENIQDIDLDREEILTAAKIFNNFKQDIKVVEEEEEEQMLLDSGVDLDVSEKFYNLSLKNVQTEQQQQQHNSSQLSQINNLDSLNLDINKKNIQLKNNNLNDLTSVTSTLAPSTITTTVTTPTVTLTSTKNKINIKEQQQQQQKQQIQPWENYYQQNEEGDTQLHLAIIHGKVDVAWALIRLSQPYSCLLGIQNDLAQAPIHLAVLTGQPTVVRSLLVAGAEATVRDRNGNSPLHLACKNGNLDCVKALITPITTTEEQLRTSLNFSKTCVCPPDMEQRNYDGERCVHIATEHNHIEILRQLVYFGADINAREGKSGLTPLHKAIEDNNTQLVNFLLEECPTIIIETKTYAGLTAYQLATLLGNRILLQELANGGAMIMSPPESDDDSDIEENMTDRFDTTTTTQSATFYQTFSGANAINVS